VSLQGRQIQQGDRWGAGLGAKHIQAGVDALLSQLKARCIHHVSGKNDRLSQGLALSGTGAGGERREKDEGEERIHFHGKRFVALHTRKRWAKLQAVL